MTFVTIPDSNAVVMFLCMYYVGYCSQFTRKLICTNRNFHKGQFRLRNPFLLSRLPACLLACPLIVRGYISDCDVDADDDGGGVLYAFRHFVAGSFWQKGLQSSCYRMFLLLLLSYCTVDFNRIKFLCIPDKTKRNMIV